MSWDVSGRYGRDKIDYHVTNTINASLGPQSPTSFYSGSWIQEEEGINSDFVYQLDAGLENPINVSFGAEWRREKFELRAGEYASYVVGPLSDLPAGANSYPGPSPEQAGSWARDSVAGYLDLDADITDRLNLTGAVRYEHFSDFGSTWNYKFSGRYEMNDWLSFRAAVSSGFPRARRHLRVPDLRANVFGDARARSQGRRPVPMRGAEPQSDREVTCAGSVGHAGAAPRGTSA